MEIFNNFIKSWRASWLFQLLRNYWELLLVGLYSLIVK